MFYLPEYSWTDGVLTMLPVVLKSSMTFWPYWAAME